MILVFTDTTARLRILSISLFAFACLCEPPNQPSANPHPHSIQHIGWSSNLLTHEPCQLLNHPCLSALVVGLLVELVEQLAFWPVRVGIVKGEQERLVRRGPRVCGLRHGATEVGQRSRWRSRDKGKDEEGLDQGRRGKGKGQGVLIL